MMRWLSLFWFKQMLRERSKRYHSGYVWAIRELHLDRDPSMSIQGYSAAFDCGVSDALRDWKSSVDADSMWAKAFDDVAADYEEDDPLEKTQELEYIDLELTQELPRSA